MSLPAKDPLEKVVITFDFTVETDTVSNPVVTVFERNTDVNLPSMVLSSPTLISNKVYALIGGGVSGKTYTVKCQVDVATTGERFVLADLLPVKSL